MTTRGLSAKTNRASPTLVLKYPTSLFEPEFLSTLSVKININKVYAHLVG